jgi:phage gp36-like protein
MAYISKTDLEKHIEETLLNALDFSGDDSVITVACSQASSQLLAYLKGKYNIAAELEKSDDARDEMLVMIAKDLAIYHIWTFCDPSSIPSARRERYTAAVDFLKSAQSGSVTVNIPVNEIFSPIEGGSNTKRINHY